MRRANTEGYTLRVKQMPIDLERIRSSLKLGKMDSENDLEYILLSLPRINFTIDQIRKYAHKDQLICEIGFGAIGLAYHLEFGAPVDAYDVNDAYKATCNHLGIPWRFLDLSEKINMPENSGKYDLIIFCEVIEHVTRSPVDILRELRDWLKPGGILLVSTVNLVRLSNRLRMLAGREIFARYEPGAFVMGHHREYTIEEMGVYLGTAGYTEVRPYFYAQPDLRYPFLLQQGYNFIVKFFPTFSNLIFALAKNPANPPCQN